MESGKSLGRGLFILFFYHSQMDRTKAALLGAGKSLPSPLSRMLPHLQDSLPHSPGIFVG